MGKALQVQTFRATNPGAALTVLTPGTGDSNAIAAYDQSSLAAIDGVWAQNAAGGVLSIHSPKMHDNSQGIRLQIPAGDELNELPLHSAQRVYPNDPLSISMSGGAAEVDTLSYLIYYDNLPGIDQTLVSWDQIKDQVRNIMGLEVDLTGGATAGDYGGSRALNADFPNQKAGERYALLGYTCKSRFTTLGITGPDTGNTRLGGPGSVRTEWTSGWFINLGEKLGRPCIPIIKADNFASTHLDLVDVVAATARPVSLIMAELG